MPAQSYTIPGIVAVLWRRKWLILLVALLSAGAAGLRNMTTPREYQGEIDILFRFGREYFPISPGEARRNWGENTIVSLDAALFTEMRLLGAQEQFERTAESVGAHPILAEPPLSPVAARVQSLVWAVTGVPSPGGAEAAQTFSELAQNLGERFEIRRVPGSAVVTVGARHSVPALADSLVVQHVGGYLERRATLLDPDADSFFEARIAAAKQEHASLMQRRLQALGDNQEGDETGRAASGPDTTDGTADTVSALDIAIAAATDNLAELERERQNWSLSREFRRDVMPTAEIIDRRKAARKPVGLGPGTRVVLAGAIGLALASAFTLLAAMLPKVWPQPKT